MIRHAENFNKTDRSVDPFKKIQRRVSVEMENLRIEEPEPRLSNASNGRQGVRLLKANSM